MRHATRVCWGVLTLYFNDNVSNLKVRVYDSGNSYLEITVNVDGIKSDGDDMNDRGVSVTAGEYMTDKNDGKWLWNPETVLSPSFTNAGAGAYAQVWFYAVKRYDSLAKANGTAIEVNTAEGSTTGWQPIGYSTNDSGFRTVSGGLEFNISTGMLSDIPAVNGDGGNGSGYYRFEFYNMNYAGYVSSTPVVRVVKVDIDTPDPTTPNGVCQHGPHRHGDAEQGQLLRQQGERPRRGRQRVHLPCGI